MRILVADDDVIIQRLIQGILEQAGHSTVTASSGEQALASIDKENFPVVISDIQMANLDGFALMARLKLLSPETVVILMTGFGSLEGAIQAMREGAFDYITKPVNPFELNHLISRAIRHWTQRKNALPVSSSSTPRTLIGNSPKIIQVYKLLAKASIAASNILIRGESGTGKELFARAIHEHSVRRNKPFVTVNCGALTETLLESELFGYVKGAFTGANTNKPGLFEEADQGTVFLDEIGDITPALQVKLLRVIQEGEYKPVGTTEVKKVDARVIAATHRDLDQLVKEEKFREDLYYRLKVISLEVPPLRERKEDIPELTRHFLRRYAEKNHKKIPTLSNEAMGHLIDYSWPGNIRELEHAVEQACALTASNVLDTEDFPSEISAQVAENNSPEPIKHPLSSTFLTLDEMEKQYVEKILRNTHFNKSRASHILGIDRATLYRKAQRYGIDVNEKKESTPYVLKSSHSIS